MKNLSGTKEKALVSLVVQNEGDVVLARRRARQLAVLLGFDRHDQTRISTAVSEISRNAVIHAKGGRLSFALNDSELPFSFVIIISDQGPGIQDVSRTLDAKSVHTGLQGASRLVDKLTVDTSAEGTIIRLQKNLTPRLPFTASEINELANSLTKLAGASLLDEVHQQNQELLLALEQLSKKQELLDELNIQLEKKNLDLRDLNEEILKLNDSLEAKVAERTDELLKANLYMEGARDEAVLANALKSQFVGSISHEIRTPMAGILGLAELLASDDELPESARDLANSISHVGEDLMLIVNDLLDFSKLEAGKIELASSPISVSNVLDDVVAAIAPLTNTKELGLTIEIDSHIPDLLYGDEQRVKQALHNLAQNAVKFTESGSISIKAGLQNLNADLAIVQFSVRDTGIGVSDETQRRLFEPFVQGDGTTTRKFGGTGLGLSIVKRFVELMHGSVGLASEEGVGSEFWFTIPLRLTENTQ